MKKMISCLFAVGVFFCMTGISFAICTSECLQYCGSGGSHGYCTDYIQYRLGVNQGGDAKNWNGTDGLSLNDIKANDVAIFDFGTYGHVAVVDSIDVNDSNYIYLSEWNWGANLDPEGNTCGVTNEYGTLHPSQRRVLKTSVTSFWRPSGGSNKTADFAYRRVGNVAWFPTNKSCSYAERWIHYDSYGNGMSLGSNSICAQEEYNMMMALGGYFSNWQTIIYGTGDISSLDVCK